MRVKCSDLNCYAAGALTGMTLAFAFAACSSNANKTSDDSDGNDSGRCNEGQVLVGDECVPAFSECSPECVGEEVCIGGVVRATPRVDRNRMFLWFQRRKRAVHGPSRRNELRRRWKRESVAFEFADEIYCGEFASSSFRGQDRGNRLWVAPKEEGGVLTLIATEPAVVGTGDQTLHGLGHEYSSMDEGFPFTGGKRGYSSDNAISLPFVQDTSVLPANNVGIGAYTLFKGVTDVGNAAIDEKCGNSPRNCEEFIVPLVLLSKPPGDVFAPAYFGPNKDMVRASDYQVALLGNWPAVQNVVGFQDAHATLQHVKMDNVQYDWNSRESHGGSANYGGARGYPGYKYQKFWSAVLRMNMEPATAEEAWLKEEMGRFLAQQAIDLYAIHKYGAGNGSPNSLCGAYMANGGFGPARLGILVIGATLINKLDWLADINETLSTHLGRQCFGETAIVQPPNSAGKNVPLFGTLSSAAYGVGATNRTAGDPNGLIDDGGNAASTCVGAYHGCCTLGPQIGEALSVLAMPTGYQNWPDNAKYFFDYIDRSYRGEGDKAYAYCDANSLDLTEFSISGYMPPGAESAWNANYSYPP